MLFRSINEYGAQVQENAKPSFPVEYLLVTLTHGFPSNPTPLFQAKPPSFVIENRDYIGQTQELQKVGDRLGLDKSGGLKKSNEGILAISDFHLLCFLHGFKFLDKVGLDSLAPYCSHTESILGRRNSPLQGCHSARSGRWICPTRN